MGSESLPARRASSPAKHTLDAVEYLVFRLGDEEYAVGILKAVVRDRPPPDGSPIYRVTTAAPRRSPMTIGSWSDARHGDATHAGACAPAAPGARNANA